MHLPNYNAETECRETHAAYPLFFFSICFLPRGFSKKELWRIFFGARPGPRPPPAPPLTSSRVFQADCRPFSLDERPRRGPRPPPSGARRQRVSAVNRDEPATELRTRRVFHGLVRHLEADTPPTPGFHLPRRLCTQPIFSLLLSLLLLHTRDFNSIYGNHASYIV